MKASLLTYVVTAVVLMPALTPTAHAGDEFQRQLWITNAYGDDVQIYEVGTWKLVRQLKVGLNPHGISATADGRTTRSIHRTESGCTSRHWVVRNE